MTISQLDLLGVRYNEDGDWQGKVEVDRRFVPNGLIKNLQLSLTPEQWCSLCMREEGRNYVGGCCGTMSAVQDTLNSTFRGGGWINAADWRHMMELCEQHDGADKYTDEDLIHALDQGLPDAVTSTWKRLIVMWQASKDSLLVEKKELPKPYRLDDFRDAVDVAFQNLGRLRYGRLFKNTEDEDGGQSSCNDLIDLAGAWGALRSVYDHLETRRDEAIEGFGLRSTDGDTGKNHYGLCLYTRCEEAERVLELWSQDKKFEPDMWSIVPFRVTIDSGFEWTDDEETTS